MTWDTSLFASLLGAVLVRGTPPRAWMVLPLFALPTIAPPAPPWGATGHQYITRAAMERLPSGVPGFFRQAEGQLEYLGPEADRWRSRTLKEMDDAWEFDHYIDLENVPPGALDASDRYEFLAALYAADIHRPQQFVGFLPWRILELSQRLETEFALWRNTPEGARRRYVEARIINDAGILGHYVGDAAQPHHTTIHFNGWAEGTPNPRGFTNDRDFHSRFESAFVDAHVSYDQVLDRVSRTPRRLEDVRASIWEEIRVSNAAVVTMYELEQTFGFNPEVPADPAAVTFVLERLGSGAEMLRDLWWNAWLQSEGLAATLRTLERQ